MTQLTSHVRARPELMASALAGIVSALALPAAMLPVTRALLGWNVAVWLYLLFVLTLMLRANHERLRRVALAHAEGAAAVLTVVVGAALASLAGIVLELAAAKAPGTAHVLPRVLFALVTVTGSWLLLPTLFTLTYASLYYRPARGAGLVFPGADAQYKPGYGDFAYVAFTIAVACQTSDVAVTQPAMRRMVLVQSLLSFAFNTAILAFTVNIAASMF
jgi:uncharacterized membrane protein